MKPRIFIGSSTEGKGIAKTLSKALSFEDCAEIEIWYQGVFTPTNSTLDNIINFLNKYDFGIFVFSPDDLTHIRGQEAWSARDNVIFELGVFISGLGKERTLFLIPADKKDFHIPSDLMGITALTYETKIDDGDKQYIVQKACHEIEERLRKLGTRAKERGTYVHIVSRKGGNCLDLKDWNMHAGAVVQQWPCHGCDNQIWILQPVSSRYYFLKSLFSGKYLEIAETSKEAEGALIRQADFTGRDTQQWIFVKLNDGTYQIINKESGKCLGMAEGETNVGADGPGHEGDLLAIRQHTWHGGDSQRWWLTVRLDWQ